jgi:hypothetical protein
VSLRFRNVARALLASAGAAFLLLASCKSDSSSGSDGGTFCGQSKKANTTCKEPSSCDGLLADSCKDLGDVVSSSTLDKARDCLESGVCGVASCLARAQKTAATSDAHAQLASDYCSTCAPSVKDCESKFYVKGSKLPGVLVLPYGEAVLSEVDSQCTGSQGCAAKFSTCAKDVAREVASESLDEDTADCLVDGFGQDEGEGPTGPGGTPDVAKCTPANCDGCCRDDQCQPGDATNACGKDGAGCQVCTGQQACTASGACKEPCGPNNCRGCCDGDTCVEGNADTKCGGDGAACTACGSGLTCSGQQCIDASCQATCTSGCCSASGCEPGTAATACGVGGGACVDCGFGRQCGAGSCVIDPNALWDFYVSFAVIPEMDSTGASWDTLAGQPDPYLLAYSSEGDSFHTGQTTTLTDSLYPFWAETPLLGVKASELMANLSFELWDSDVDFDDYIGGCQIPLTPAVFDGSLQNYVCPASATSVSVELYYRINPHAP